ncbi:suppressor of inhibitory function of ChpA [Deferribacter desulfuricans SSM1]|uniref:Suppressor of inhibitory function of ChpA n=1 Tax=Deferribacter desulfuricans (strain DSM 14783 / JCM 11476 / NBRC 101012 / SSM1) TaxID=639282 RepID=D3PCQ0_DEFDS|nr:AbrB/MazE/SpoVT family DNA-binding domain-containing protein [Deferribacter desulfuricans]BAI80373.1 suppressor of inhibitory function of ChpA [Deferribacter desulfuricans SSM1]
MAIIQKWGNSQGIRIPKRYLRKIGLDVGDVIEIEIKGNNLILKPVKSIKKPKINIYDLFEKDKDYKTEEYDWQKPQGKEVW